MKNSEILPKFRCRVESGKIICEGQIKDCLDEYLKTSEVLSLYQIYGPMTDREVAKRMGSDDPNTSRPRITELLAKNLLKECGSVKDIKTEKNRPLGAGD